MDSMGRQVSIIMADRGSRWLLISSLILNGLVWLVIWRWWPYATGAVPLHYTIYFGINLTGSWLGLFALPALGLIAIVSHLFINLSNRQVMWWRLWGLLSLVMNLLAALAVAAVMYVVRVNSL